MPNATLADTCWPRSGFDTRNSACIPFAGPDTPTVLWDLELTDTLTSKDWPLPQGAIVASDGNLRVISGGRMHSVSDAGRLLWTVPSPPREYGSHIGGLPIALSDGSVLFWANYRLVLERDGQSESVAEVRGGDCGPSPNISREGVVLAGQGEIFVWDNERLRSLGDFGFDIVHPAIYPDGTLAVAAYAGLGLSRIALDGNILWSTQPEDADRLTVINLHDEVACASLNDHITVVVDAEGVELWRYPRVATFSCHPDGGWNALAKGRVERLSRSGQGVWSAPLETWPDSGSTQAIADIRGNLYIPCRQGLAAFDPDGQLLFQTNFTRGEPPALDLPGLCPVGPGRMALVRRNRLMLIG